MSFKSETNKQLMVYYEKQGINKTLAMATQLLKANTHKDNKVFHAHVHGEICETVLECMVLDYMRKNPIQTKNWFYHKGLIIKDINNPNSGYFTELDFVLCTPQQLFAFECKSYGGDKKLVDKCTIKKKKGGSFDVYGQHDRHVEVLSNQLNAFRFKERKEIKAYTLALFNFSLGATEDCREPMYKEFMPCIEPSNLYELLRKYKNYPEIWDMSNLHKAIEIIAKRETKNSKKHLEYVKQLKH